VLVVHHPGKDQKKGARGSVALKGATDAEFELTRKDDEVKLTNQKQKDGEEAQPISLELARVKLPDGDTSRVVRATEGGMVRTAAAELPKVDPRIVKTDAGLLKALAEFGRAAPPYPNGNEQRIERTTLFTRAATGWWRPAKCVSTRRPPAMSSWSPTAVQVQDWSRMDRNWSRSRKLVQYPLFRGYWSTELGGGPDQAGEVVNAAESSWL
jgi:hypothetical protein